MIQQKSEERLIICRGCSYNSENKKKAGWSTIRPDEHCTNCGCTLAPKVKCLSCECPDKKWLSITTVEQDKEITKNLIK